MEQSTRLQMEHRIQVLTRPMDVTHLMKGGGIRQLIDVVEKMVRWSNSEPAHIWLIPNSVTVGPRLQLARMGDDTKDRRRFQDRWYPN